MQRMHGVVQSKGGRVVVGALIQVFITGTSTPVTIYSDRAGTQEVTQLLSDNEGEWSFYAPNGRYDIKTVINGRVDGQLIDVLLHDPADVPDDGIDASVLVEINAIKADIVALETDQSNLSSQVQEVDGKAKDFDNAHGTEAIKGNWADGRVAPVAELADDTGANMIGHGVTTVGATLNTHATSITELVEAVDAAEDALIEVNNKLSEIVSVKDFGAKGDGVTDDTAALNAAFNAGASYVPPGVYKCTGKITLTGSAYSTGSGATFSFALGSTPIDHLVYMTGEGDLTNIMVDGTTSSNVASGVWLNADTWTPTRRVKVNVRVKNIKNTDATKACYGLVYYISSSCSRDGYQADITADVTDVTGTANGTIGDTGGSSVGIHVSINKSGMTNSINILSPKVARVTPAEDGDGIVVYVADYTSTTQKSSFVIRDAVVSSCAKRGIKSQAPNCMIANAVVNMDSSDGTTSSLLGIDCYGVNNTVLAPTVLSTNGGDGVRGAGDGFKCIQPNIRMLSAVAPIRIAGAKDFIVDGGRIYTGHSFANSDSGAVQVQGGHGHVNAPRCENLNSTGSAVVVEGVASADVVTVRIPTHSKSGVLFRAISCVGRVVLEKAYGTVSGRGVDVTDCNDVRVEHVDVTTTGTGQIGVYSVRSTVQLIGAGRLSGFQHGYLTSGTALGTGVRRVAGGWFFVNGLGTGVGIDAGAANAEVVGVFTQGFSTHIQADYSTGTFIGGNRARGAGTHITTTGATGLVQYDNYIIV